MAQNTVGQYRQVSRYTKSEMAKIGAYLVSTVKGQSVADWDGNMWQFRDSKMRGGILRVIEAV